MTYGGIRRVADRHDRGARVYIRVPKIGTEGKAGGACGKKCEAGPRTRTRSGLQREEARTIGAVKADCISCWIFRMHRPDGGVTIFPTSAALRMSVPWSFMKRASPNAAITENSRSKRYQDRTTMPACARC